MLLHPELKNCYTVKTNKGYHIYFQYDSSINSKINALINYKNVDIRNDKALIFAPPTEYFLLSGEVSKYECIMNVKLTDVPQYLKDELKENEVHQITKKKRNITKVNI